ncbi:MAG: serine/threonine-protein kinase [Pseudomonadota bacterium]
MLSPTGVSDSNSLADDPLAGQPYRAIRLLGAGGMGEVFLAEHRTLATLCVVKIQHTRLARDPSIADRIRLEAESLSRLNHANIVAIIGSGETLDERPFIVMEYLRGQTMADELAARGQLPMLEALSYTCQLLRGLAAAHAVGIVHRDIKPDNLFLCDGPRSSRVLKLLDFGVACTMPDALALGANPLAVPTATGTVVGALRYVSPEGALAQRVDHRADLYSAALVLYFALAGRGPFDHIQNALLLLSAHVAEQPEPPSRFSKAAIPAELDRAVLRALRKAPADRFQSAHELREELERIMNELRRSPHASQVRSSPEASQRGAELADPGTASIGGLDRDGGSGARIRSATMLGAEQAPVEQAGPLRVGARFLDKYEIRQQIGRGGQAWVYHGQHIFAAREVAIKVVHSARGMTHEMLERGKAEARALGKLDHPNIVVMHDAGVTDEGLFYIVMELLRGRSLRSALAAHGRFAIEEVLQLAICAAEAVQVAHDRGLIHRDLTPDNIYLTRDNRLKVLDFGIAKVLNEFGFTTHMDIVMGSILYMSPEQVQGLPLSSSSDICALGLMVFEMLIGQHPSLLLFERDLADRNEPHRRATLAEIPPIQMHRMPPLLSELDPHIPMHLAQVVHRAIAKNPEARFSTMRDFASALRLCQETFSSEAPITHRRASDRDLSLHVDREPDEPPASQRATPKRGLVWHGTGSLTSAAPPIEHLAVTRAIGAITASAAGDRSAPRRAVASRRPIASRRNSIMLGCLLGAALGSLGVLRHFDTANRLASQMPAELSTVSGTTDVSNSLVASLLPALPVSTPEGSRALPAQPGYDLSAASDLSRLGPPPATRATVQHDPAPSARATRTPTTATVSAQSGQQLTDVSLPLEIRLGSKRRQDVGSNREGSRQKLNGGKLIYGD